MPNLDSYTVYNATTNEAVYEGTFIDCQDYMENPKFYIVWEYNGMVL